ncbi:E3 ubiquitin-protein ligase TRIM56-like [Patiria miniata]|uniref:Uncharacterized protein n=1 Tax=Patiria miniata TaxID=46514 RepID=A0A914ASN2_PATMI|nr:E3 ubiquitin-protein ligase TRIM56-like [Patiria miniata]
MATAALKNISKNHLECSICQDRYDKPKILACLHSFCEKCLVDYHSGRYHDSPRIPCPLCRQETVLPQKGVSALKTNFFITSLMADVTLQDQVGDVSPICDICGTNDAMHRCLDCSKNICKGCLGYHKQFPDLLDHTVATLEDIRQGKVVANKKKKRGGHFQCGQHLGEVRRFYCQSCHELICRDCTVIDHPNTKGHDYVDLKTASTKLRKMLSGKLPELDKKKKGLEGVHKAARETKEKLKTNSERASLEVQKGAAKMIENIEKERDRILKEVKNITVTRNEKLNQSEKDVTTTMLRIKHSQEIIQDIIRNAEDSDFLALFPEIKRDLQALSILDMPRVNDELSVLNVRSRETSGVKDLWELQLEPERRRMQIHFHSFPDDLETDG